MLTIDELPFLTSDVPPVGGQLKARREDFIVHELPLYQPSGIGTHLYFRIEKIGQPTMQIVHDIARALGRSPRDIGYAGLKDADAVTTQTLSIEHIDPARIEKLDLPKVRVLSISRHTNKLKLGHLAGNRFTLKLRDADPARVNDVRAITDTLSARGAPNYFGPQRFGLRGDTWRIGRALLEGDDTQAIAVMLGEPGPGDYGEVKRARELFDQGDYAAAAHTWPYPFRNERRACHAMARARGNARRALAALDKQIKRFYVAAYQSHLFNQIVARRIGSIDRLLDGDLAWRHPQGAVFHVEDPPKEQPRCDAFEISPTGPLFGYRMTRPGGEPGRIEQELLAREDVNPDDWRESHRHRVKGARRPLRCRPADAAVTDGHDDAGPFIQLTFTLEAGCYATTIMREIIKAPSHPANPATEGGDT